MHCALDACPNRPVVKVIFAVTGKAYLYCRYHAFRNGKLRWHPDRVLDVEDI